MGEVLDSFDFDAIRDRMIELGILEYCHECEDCGWTYSWGPEGRGPYFEECTKCGNPNGYDRPPV